MFKVYVEKSDEYLRIVNIYDNDKISQCYIEDALLKLKVGNIYLGKVERMANLMRGYYVNIGLDKLCFMPKNKMYKNLKLGDNVLVEILKEGISNKGAVVTSKISLGGSMVVIKRGNGRRIFSKKIRDYKTINKYKGFKVESYIDLVFRNNIKGASEDDVKGEYEKLLKEFNNILNKEKYNLNLGMVFESRGSIREFMSKIDFNAKYNIITNKKDTYNMVSEEIKLLPDRVLQNIKLELDNTEPLFMKYNIEQRIIDFRCRKIKLISGAELIIDRKEALTVIDVNSAKVRDNETYENVNLDCARSIPELIISRNLSGIIIIDFINMRNIETKKQIIELLKRGFVKDRNKTNINDFDILGLVHISRERRGKSIYEYMDETIENNLYTINRLKFSYICFLIKNKIIYEGLLEYKSLTIELPSVYRHSIDSNYAFFIDYIGCSHIKIELVYDDFIENFKIRKNIT